MGDVETMRGWRRRASEKSGIAGCSLIVPTFQRPKDVVGLLDELASLPDVPAEVVVVDGSPGEETARSVAQWAEGRALRFDLGFVRSPAGLTRQRNVGIDATRGDVVFFLDDDCRAEPGYFRDIAGLFQADASRRLGALSGSVVGEDEGAIPWRWRVRFLLGLLPKDAEPGRYYPIATSVPRCVRPLDSGTRPVDSLLGCTMAFRREVLERHRFSAFFDGYSQGEDLEMGLRVGRDWNLLWSGDARLRNVHAMGGRPNPFRKGRMEVRNRFFIWKRHSPDVPLLERFRFWMDIGVVFAFDLVYALFRPPRLDHLRHALGVARGALECWFRPPVWQEPPARREYEIAWEERSA